MPVVCDEDVLGFQVAVNDTRGVKTLNTLDDLSGIEPRPVAT